MRNHSFLAPLTLALALLLPGRSAQAQAGDAAAIQNKAHHAIFVLTSGEDADWQMTLANMRNMIKGFAPAKVEIELVAYGPGLPFLKKGSAVQTEIQELEAQQVRFVACENSMRLQHVTAADLAPGVTAVPSGVIELVTRQEQGWAYVKAGR